MRRTVWWLGVLLSTGVMAQTAPTAAAETAQTNEVITPADETGTGEAAAEGVAEPGADGSGEAAGQFAGGEAADPMAPPQDVTARIPTQGYPLKVRRGLFAETNLGTFFTVGGDDYYSNAQTYVQLGLGYDLFETFEVGAHVAFGSSAFNCFAGRQNDVCPQSDAFTITFVNASFAYLLRLGDRFYLTPKLVGGYAFMDPSPIAGVSRGPNVGAGIGLEYATSMDHFSIGADVVGRYILNAGIPALSIMPRVKYTF